MAMLNNQRVYISHQKSHQVLWKTSILFILPIIIPLYPTWSPSNLSVMEVSEKILLSIHPFFHRVFPEKKDIQLLIQLHSLRRHKTWRPKHSRTVCQALWRGAKRYWRGFRACWTSPVQAWTRGNFCRFSWWRICWRRRKSATQRWTHTTGTGD